VSERERERERERANKTPKNQKNKSARTSAVPCITDFLP